MAIDLQKGQDRAKPDPASPYADTDGIQHNASTLLKHGLTLLTSENRTQVILWQRHRRLDK